MEGEMGRGTWIISSTPANSVGNIFQIDISKLLKLLSDYFLYCQLIGGMKTIRKQVGKINEKRERKKGGKER